MSDSETPAVPLYPEHPIQLKAVVVLELTISKPSHITKEYLASASFAISMAESQFNEAEGTFNVALKFENGDPETESEGEDANRLKVKVELFGAFKVVEPNVSPDQVHEFARLYAPVLLMPFLREHVYGLSLKAGIPPIIIPLYQKGTAKDLQPLLE